MKTLPQIFFESRLRPENQKALLFKRRGEWSSLSWAQFYRLAESFAHHLLHSGVNAGDRVAIFSETRFEWAVTDLAIQCMGGITVPVYANGNSEELEHILKDSGATYLIADGAGQMKKWNSVSSRCPLIRQVLSFDEGTWEAAAQAGSKLAAASPDVIPERIRQSRIDDDATVVYTSGTSGAPKGVVLTQRQIVSEITDITKIFRVDHRDQTLSFLPYAHVLGRLDMWLSIHSGHTVGFAESIDRIRENLIEIPPTVIISVPRIFEKIFAAISGRIERVPALSRFFGLAARLDENAANWLKGKFLARQIRPAFGGRLRFAISGGAPLAKDIAVFFRAAGIPIYEGYGLTETTGAITVNTPENHRSGTVGRPLPDVQLQIAEDGEILVKSEKVMARYYRQETPMDLKNGFFPTGDIGHLEDGYLVITDRKKDLIKTSGGKYVAPQKLENVLKASALISQVLIHGDREKYIVALITLNEPEIRSWAKARQLTFADYGDLSRKPEVRGAVANLIADANAGLSNYETIKKFAILDHDLTVADGELTPSLKVKRKFCEEKYRNVIQELYRST